jgi:hypothetical protein
MPVIGAKAFGQILHFIHEATGGYLIFSYLKG